MRAISATSCRWPGPVGDGRAADERRPLVDRLGEALGRDRAVGAPARTWTTSAPRSSCACAIWPTVGNSYSLITIFAASPRASGERADDAVHALADRRGDGDLARLCVQQPCERGPRRLRPLDPVAPLGAVRVPAVEVLLVGGAHPVRERALRARVQVRRVREDRELAPDRRAHPAGGHRHDPKPKRLGGAPWYGPAEPTSRRRRCCSTSCGSSPISPRRARSAPSRSSRSGSRRPARTSARASTDSPTGAAASRSSRRTARRRSRRRPPLGSVAALHGHADPPDRGGDPDRRRGDRLPRLRRRLRRRRRDRTAVRRASSRPRSSRAARVDFGRHYRPR